MKYKNIILIGLLFSTNLIGDNVCNYSKTINIKYLGHKYEYIPGNINDTCVKVFTTTTHLIKDENVEIPTSSSWKITPEGECRCIDNTSPESMWNKTFPNDNSILTTKEVLWNFKKVIGSKDIVVDEDRKMNEEDKKGTFIAKSDKVKKFEEDKKSSKSKSYAKSTYVKEKEIVTNDAFINTLSLTENEKYDIEQLKLLKSSVNNTFITTKDYMVDILLKEKGEYKVELELSKDINILQIFNEDLERIKEFKFTDPYLVKGEFTLKISASQRITLVSLNPFGQGKLKGISNIKITKL